MLKGFFLGCFIGALTSLIGFELGTSSVHAKPDAEPAKFTKLEADSITVGDLVIAKGGQGSAGIWIGGNNSGRMISIYSNREQGAVIGFWSEKAGQHMGMN